MKDKLAAWLPDRQTSFLIIGLLLIGYAIAFMSRPDSFPPLTTGQLGLAAGLGLLYLALALAADTFFLRYTSPFAKTAYFTAYLGAAILLQLLLGPNGIWLVLLPVVGTAVEQLSSPARWPIYIGVLAGFGLPVWLVTRDTAAAISFVVTFSPAILFVVIFTQLRNNERDARRKAEQLTADLEKANQQLAAANQQLAAANQQLAAANQQLAAYALQAEELATTQERNRLAREIHDNLGHYLTVANVQLEAAQVVMAQNPHKAAEAVGKAQTLVQEGLGAVRQSVAALRESPLGNRPLPDAIADLLAETERSGITTTRHVAGQPRPLDPKTELTLYRVAQESLTNVRKHAGATTVTVQLDYTRPEQVTLTAHDDGVGTADPHRAGSFGLIGIRERVQMLGGTVTIETAPGEGFLLTAQVPG